MFFTQTAFNLQMVQSRAFFLIVLVSFLAPFNMEGQRGGESLFGILHLTPSARINALGGYQPALYTKDPSLVLYNPALADSSFHKNVSLGYSPYLADISYGYGSVTWNIRGTGTFFAGVNHLGYGDMVMADEYGEKTGQFTASESVILLGYAKKLSPRFTAGLTFKPVLSTLESYSSWGIALDAGVHYNHPNGRLHGAVLLRNAGRQISSYSGSSTETLPPDLQIGISTSLKHAPFRFSLTARNLLSGSLDFQIPENEYGINVSQPDAANAGFGDLLLRHLVVGVEFLPFDNFYVGGGLNPGRRHELKVDSKVSTVGYSWGFGFRVYKFHFSYSSAQYHLASSANHFSITTNISDF